MPPTGLNDVLFPRRDTRLGVVARALSGTETGPPADNFVTNEDSFARVAGELDRLAPADGVYLGVGPDLNLTYIAHCRPRLAFVLDHRRRNALLHLLHKALFALAPDRAGYLERLTARRPVGPIGPDADAATLVRAFEEAPLDRARLDAAITEVRRYLEPCDVVRDDEWAALATIQARLAGPGLRARFLALPIYPTLSQLIRTPDRAGRPAHLLAAEATYQAVRSRQLGDRVLPLVGDFAGRDDLPRLGAWLRRHGLALSVVYVSYVEFFLFRAGRFARYVENLAGLPWKPGAVLIRSSTRAIPHPERVAGDHSTTLLRPVASFLESARAGEIRGIDDLFRAR